MPTLEEQVEEALVALGESSNTVAQTLAANECRGHRKQGDACPVYAYLNKLYPGQIYSVDSGEVALRVGDEYAYVDPPCGVADFIGQFDAGSFNELAVE